MSDSDRIAKLVDKFTSDLQAYTPSQCVTNPYMAGCPYWQTNVSNLKNYFEKMWLLKPKTMLVGEAPGYKGCLKTGIPFTCEQNLITEYKKGCLFGSGNGFNVSNPQNITSEVTACIVWNNLSALNFYPLLWNAFPFHPYCNVTPNRKPTDQECDDIGLPFLQELVQIYGITDIISVGHTAEKALKRAGIPSTYIRHPSHGGAGEFSQGLRQCIILQFLKEHPNNQYCDDCLSVLCNINPSQQVTQICNNCIANKITTQTALCSKCGIVKQTRKIK